jgi:DNA-binding NarL/FixJ family response regulator
MRILIAVYFRPLLSALGAWIKELTEFTLVGAVSDAESLLEQAEATQPDLVLLDWELRITPTADLIAALHALHSRPKVLVLSIRLENEETALAAGADAFMVKGDPTRRLLTTLQQMKLEIEAERTHAV